MPKETATATMTENKRKELPPKTVTTATTATAQSSDANSNSNKNDTHGSFDGKRGGKTIGLTIPFDLGKIDDNIKLKILDLYSNKLQGTYSTIDVTYSCVAQTCLCCPPFSPFVCLFAVFIFLLSK